MTRNIITLLPVVEDGKWLGEIPVEFSAQCASCKHYKYNMECEAFPIIPEEISLKGFDHTQPWPDEDEPQDGGIRYEPVSKAAIAIHGGPGSGHHGHRGRPGKRGGSLPGDKVGAAARDELAEWVRQESLKELEPDERAKEVSEREKAVEQLVSEFEGDKIKSFFLTAADSKDVKETLKELTYLREKYPYLFSKESNLHIHEFGVTWRDLGFSGTALGSWHNADDVLLLSGPALRDKHGIEKLTLSGWKSTTDTFSGTLRHEFGHAIFDTVLTAQKKSYWQTYIHERISSMHISEYSRTSYEEKFAEAFRAFSHPDYKKGMMPEEIESFFEKNLRVAPTTQAAIHGGPGSGHHGHRGRPGKRGGSLPGKGTATKPGEPTGWKDAETEEEAIQRLSDEFGISVAVHSTAFMDWKDPMASRLLALNEIGQDLTKVRNLLGKEELFNDRMDELSGYRIRIMDHIPDGDPLARHFISQRLIYMSTKPVKMALGVDEVVTLGPQYWKSSTLSFSSSFRHELGHAINETFSQKEKDRWWEIYDKDWGYWEKVSRYAEENKRECFAECFRAYTTESYGKVGYEGNPPSRLPEEVENFLKSL